MKIAIINGNAAYNSFDEYLDELRMTIEKKGHTAKIISLNNADLKYCTGCFGCWYQTPGKCFSKDGSEAVCRAVINSDFTLWASPLKAGFISSKLKTAFDKLIPILHPYCVVDNYESHHMPRYAKYPRWGFILDKNTVNDADDIPVMKDILCRTALNFKTSIEFIKDTNISFDQIADLIINPADIIKIPEYLKPLPGIKIDPPSSVTLINGSLRQKNSNTEIMLKAVAGGMNIPNRFFSLSGKTDFKEYIDIFNNSDCVIIGFPLYTDAMPGQVKAFFEAIDALSVKNSNPPIGFIVQSGFPEAVHSRFIEKYLKRFADKLKSPYLGTIVKGGGEAIRDIKEFQKHKIFKLLKSLGSDLAGKGKFNDDSIKKIAGLEKFPKWTGIVFKFLLKTPLAQSGMNKEMKKFGTLKKHKAMPYIEIN